MARRLFTLRVSLVVCGLIAVLWVRSYLATDCYDIRSGKLCSAAGSLSFSHYSTLRETEWSFLGFRSVVHRTTYVPMRSLEMTYWFPALASGLLVLACVRTGRPDLAGRCPHCGYDLRESPGRCPECGATPSTMTVPA